MIPTLSVPNMQVPPPVEVSVFTGQNADAALGRLPVVTVPPTVTSAKVADDGRGQQQQRNPQQTPAAPDAQFSVSTQGGTGELAFASPYSTTFVAQLFGQFQTGDAGLGALSGQSTDIPLGFVDFDRLSQFDITKYMPSFAFRPRAETPQQPMMQQQQPAQQVAAPVQPNLFDSVAPDAVAAPSDNAPAAEVAPQQPAASAVVASVAAQTASQQVSQQSAAPQASASSATPRQPSASVTSLREAAGSVLSLFSNGSEAYGATQSRNLFNLAGGQGASATSAFSLVL
jgi:hypothetical protein